MFGAEFEFVKGGKLPGLYGGHSRWRWGWGGRCRCSGGAEVGDCWSLRFMWRRDGQGEVYAYLPNEQVS